MRCRLALSPKLIDATDDSDRPLLHGAAAASELMRLLERGCRFPRVFPAAPN
jgi:2-dehydro-3-deoxyphosphogluconate aldolase/(4S)-4-hydroxy-2-oxoglutarate aldolase